jgi:hypothetical protein
MEVAFEIRSREFSDKFWLWFVWLLPRRMIMWCAIRLIAYATSGKYGDTIVPELSAMDALKRWDE